MKQAVVDPNDGQNIELKLVCRTVAFLALLTGALYLRAMVVEGAVMASAGPLLLSGTAVIAVLVVALLGLVIGWQRPFTGGLLALLGGLALGAQVFLGSGGLAWLAAFVYASPLVIAGAFYLIYDWRRERN